MFSENASSADNQQERLQNLGHYLAGFVDGEGSFNVSLRRKEDYYIKWQVVLSFNVSQRDITVLQILKDTLRCGIIKVRKCDSLYSYDVTKPRDILTKVIPYFDEFNFLSPTKQKNYRIFKEISNLANKKPVDTLTLFRIMELREKLNEGRGRKRKYTIQDVFGVSPETIRQAPVEGDDIVRPTWRHVEPDRNVQAHMLKNSYE
jgi:hypothetical protein